MKILPVDIDDLVLVLDSNGMEFHLDLETGEIRLRPEDDLDEEFEQLLERQPQRFLYIEPVSSRDGFRIMEDFVREKVDDPRASDSLVRALEDRKPFRSFKDRLFDYPEIRESPPPPPPPPLRQLALEWLAEEGIGLPQSTD
ncbi:hypothetical protein PKB_0448 [Pseudomonas knackmussii B13]|uniref:Uncharacterized protein n=1 Tax=Pseudomonas knackmussii (strain DSM 6978 / CCUG 54928 / LMG 23759 / B13) TaxID=1301098 RepID=A0A024HAD5_PSEKB|nr:UPF0158 family protein [Pseudomonas knackmussii]CDF81826.1 hypothetical protein PKB_0448 [Pseudomonas knackmussii B13]